MSERGPYIGWRTGNSAWELALGPDRGGRAPTTYGEAIKAARIRARLTQERLAAQVGIARSLLAMYESGKRTLGRWDPAWQRLCEALPELQSFGKAKPTKVSR